MAVVTVKNIMSDKVKLFMLPLVIFIWDIKFWGSWVTKKYLNLQHLTFFETK